MNSIKSVIIHNLARIEELLAAPGLSSTLESSLRAEKEAFSFFQEKLAQGEQLSPIGLQVVTLAQLRMDCADPQLISHAQSVLLAIAAQAAQEEVVLTSP